VKKYINENVGVCDHFVVGVRWRPGIRLQTAVPFPFTWILKRLCYVVHITNLHTSGSLISAGMCNFSSQFTRAETVYVKFM
jgi:hypothetical protein